MNKDIQEFLDLIDEFQFASNKFVSYYWFWKKVLYLPVGMMIENYWLHRMSHINKRMENFNIRLDKNYD